MPSGLILKYYRCGMGYGSSHWGSKSFRDGASNVLIRDGVELSEAGWQVGIARTGFKAETSSTASWQKTLVQTTLLWNSSNVNLPGKDAWACLCASDAWQFPRSIWKIFGSVPQSSRYVSTNSSKSAYSFMMCISRLKIPRSTVQSWRTLFLLLFL